MRVRWIALCALVHASVGSMLPVATQNNLAITTAVDVLKLRGVLSKNSTAHSTTGTVKDGRRRGKKKSRSTSSSSGEKYGDKSGDSLGIDESDTETSTDVSDERTTKRLWTRPGGTRWRKWHRKCEVCPEDMVKKWRDPTIKWVCGGYQRARRSFKSECMMAYRNCQDGTMFVKLHEHRCDDTKPGWNNGRHFFYDYRAVLMDESSSSDDSSSGDSSPTSDDTDDFRVAF